MVAKLNWSAGGVDEVLCTVHGAVEPLFRCRMSPKRVHELVAMHFIVEICPQCVLEVYEK